jgi:hypothetical protein
LPKAAHFDADALADAVLAQPIGLRVSTNHPAGFRRLMYLVARRNPARRLQILQCPKSATAFLLVKPSVELGGKS